MKKNIKDYLLNIRNKYNIILIIAIIIISITLLFYGYNYFKYEINVSKEEQEKRKIDEYNFEQLKNAKVILNKISENAEKFYYLKDFNKIYGVNIIPIKNCYYVSNDNGKYPYLFGFKLYSDKYIEKKGKDYYVYPGYNLPVIPQCAGSNIGKLGLKGGCIKDILYFDFIRTISNPCQN